MFEFGSVPEAQQVRKWGHLGVALLIDLWAVYLIRRELANFTRVRHARKFCSPNDIIHLCCGQTLQVMLTLGCLLLALSWSRASRKSG